MNAPMTSLNTITFTPSERAVFARLPFQPVAPWAEQNIIVPDGRFKNTPLRLSISPFLAGPMNVFSVPNVREVIVCGSLQVGKTLFLYACLTWSMFYRPGVSMLTMPTKESRQRVLEKKLKPLLMGSPSIRRKVHKIRTDSVLLADGTSVELPTAESPSGRATITVYTLGVDEEDLYGGAGRANPLQDFKGRTRSHEDEAKIARSCQPKGGEDSSIWRGITQEAHVLFCYEVTCPLPLCGHTHLMNLEQLVAEEGEQAPHEITRRKLGRYQCPSCKARWTDHLRNQAVTLGYWWPYTWSAESGFTRIDAPGPDLLELMRCMSGEMPAPGAFVPSVVGFHMPAILSRMVSLSDLLARKLAADQSDDPAVQQQFANDDLALPYTPVKVAATEDKILERRALWLPARWVPQGAVALSCGIDVQRHGFWFLVRAWMPTLASYIIDYGHLPGWSDVSDLLFATAYPVLPPDVSWAAGQPYPEQSGEVMPIWRAAIDSGGTETEGVYTRTEEVYLWVRANGHGVAHATKGASHVQTVNVRSTVRERMPRSGRPIPGGLNLYMLNSHNLKTVDMGRLLNPESTQPIYLHAEADSTIARHLSAEKLVRRGSRDVWESVHSDNHLHDCLHLSGACADLSWTPSLPHYVLQLEQAQRAANAGQQAKPRKNREQRRQSSDRWG